MEVFISSFIKADNISNLDINKNSFSNVLIMPIHLIDYIIQNTNSKLVTSDIV